jgi:hypothetical protein
MQLGLKVILFIYGLFNSFLSTSDYVETCFRIINELLTGNNVELSGRGIFQITSSIFAWR